MARFASLFLAFAAGLSALAAPALAGGSSIGTVGAVPSLNRSFGSVPASAPSFVSSAGVGSNISLANGINVQTNIDASRNVQAGHSISVNETVNGQPVGSSYASASFLNVMTQAQADAADIMAQRQAANQQLYNEVLMVTQMWQGQGY